MAATTITQPIAVKADATMVDSRAEMSGGEPVPAEPISTKAAQTSPVQIGLILLGAIAFLYFARPVVLPVILAGIAGMTLKPLIRWLSCGHIPPTLSAAVVVGLLVAGIGIGFFQLGR
ncbi:MAG TPA: hypothetical protein VF492_09665, partial [Verrucomicrobiae bacterium]